MTSDKTTGGSHAAPDYEAMAKDMMQQWQDSWKSMLKDGPAAAATPEQADAEQPAAPAADMMQQWQGMVQPMMAATQQFWQQMLAPAGSEFMPHAPQEEGTDAPDAGRSGPEPSRPAEPVAAAAAAPHAGADAYAELARRVDLLSQRLLRCEVELDKLKRGTASQ